MSIHKAHDWVTGFGSFLAAWGVPILGILLSSFLFPGTISIVWPIAFAWMGIACLINGARCDRVHCYFTGFFFILIGIISLLPKLGWISFSGHDWEILGGTAAVGGAVIWLGSEKIFGRYFGKKRSAPRE